MEMNKKTISSSKGKPCDFGVEKDASSRNESVEDVEVIPEVEKAEVVRDISTEMKQEIVACEDDVSDENTNSDSSSYDEETQIALNAAKYVRSLAKSCRSIVSTTTDIFSDGLMKFEGAIDNIDQVQHTEKAKLMATAQKYMNAVEILLNNSYEAEKAAERADAKACRAEAAVIGLYKLQDEKSNYSEDFEIEVIIAKTAASKKIITAWKAGDDAVKATNELWQEIDKVQNLEASLKKLIELINSKADYSILCTFIIVVTLSACIAVAINAYFKMDVYSLYLISMTGCLLVLGTSVISLLTYVDEEHSDEEMEKSNALENLEMRLHRLNKDLEAKKAAFLNY